MIIKLSILVEIALKYNIMSQQKWTLLCIEVEWCFCGQSLDFRQWALSAQHFIEIQSELGNKCILVAVHPSMKCRWPHFWCRHKAQFLGLKYSRHWKTTARRKKSSHRNASIRQTGTTEASELCTLSNSSKTKRYMSQEPRSNQLIHQHAKSVTSLKFCTINHIFDLGSGL